MFISSKVAADLIAIREYAAAWRSNTVLQALNLLNAVPATYHLT